jgi:hypothetical protein
MTDSIEVTLGGNWINLFKPLGRVVVLIWLVSCANLTVFNVWAKRRVKQLEDEELEDDEAAALKHLPDDTSVTSTRVA